MKQKTLRDFLNLHSNIFQKLSVKLQIESNVVWFILLNNFTLLPNNGSHIYIKRIMMRMTAGHELELLELTDNQDKDMFY